MNNPLSQELSYLRCLRTQQMRIDDTKYRAALYIFHGSPRKPLWAKIEEEVTMAYESLRRSCEHSVRSVSTITVADIIAQYRKEHPDPASEPVLVWPRSIFREFYHKVVVNEE